MDFSFPLSKDLVGRKVRRLKDSPFDNRMKEGDVRTIVDVFSSRNGVAISFPERGRSWKSDSHMLTQNWELLPETKPFKDPNYNEAFI